MVKGKTDKKTIVVEMDTPQEKKRVVRYDALDPKAPMTSAYVSKEALTAIGNPDKIKVTVEAAD